MDRLAFCRRGDRSLFLAMRASPWSTLPLLLCPLCRLGRGVLSGDSRLLSSRAPLGDVPLGSAPSLPCCSTNPAGPRVSGSATGRGHSARRGFTEAEPPAVPFCLGFRGPPPPSVHPPSPLLCGGMTPASTHPSYRAEPRVAGMAQLHFSWSQAGKHPPKGPSVTTLGPAKAALGPLPQEQGVSGTAPTPCPSQQHQQHSRGPGRSPGCSACLGPRPARITHPPVGPSRGPQAPSPTRAGAPQCLDVPGLLPCSLPAAHPRAIPSRPRPLLPTGCARPNNPS